jgi:hypothetical protein
MCPVNPLGRLPIRSKSEKHMRARELMFIGKATPLPMKPNLTGI